MKNLSLVLKKVKCNSDSLQWTVKERSERIKLFPDYFIMSHKIGQANK